MKIFRQTNGYSCGPRALQIAFSHYGVFPKYTDIFDKCGTDAYGTPLENFYGVVEHFGLCCAEHEEDATVDLIKKYTDSGIPVIVMWYAGGDDHVSVAYQVDDTYVYLIDPASHLYTEPTILIRRSMLERCWKTHKDSRWIMAILECME